MSSGVLSQEEIDALLKGDAPMEPQPSLAQPQPSITQSQTEVLSDIEKDTIGEIANMSMGSAATALSTLLGRKVDITTPQVTISDLDQLQSKYPRPYVVVNVEYISGINGSNLLIIKETDASIIVDLMMGGDGKNPSSTMEEMQMSAVAEAMNQMMGSAATAMSTILSKRVDISPPKLDFKDFSKGELQDPKLINPPQFVTVAFRMNIEGLIDSEIMQLIPFELAKAMTQTLLGTIDTPQEPVQQPIPVSVPQAPIQAPAQYAAPEPAQYAAPAQAQYAPQAQNAAPAPAQYAAPAQAQYAPQVQYAAPAPAPQAYSAPAMPNPAQQPMSQPVSVQPVQFAPLHQPTSPLDGTNINILMDVPLQITVELGRAKKTIRDILTMAPGSVIELDKIAGEPVDLMVNGKLLAKGEVVVIDENFGIRVTDIISPLERVANLQ